MYHSARGVRVTTRTTGSNETRVHTRWREHGEGSSDWVGTFAYGWLMASVATGGFLLLDDFRLASVHPVGWTVVALLFATAIIFVVYGLTRPKPKDPAARTARVQAALRAAELREQEMAEAKQRDDCARHRQIKAAERDAAHLARMAQIDANRNRRQG